MLWQLAQAGKLDGVKGIVFGEMLDCHTLGAPAELLDEVILRVFDDFHGPIAIGLRSGHVSGPTSRLHLAWKLNSLPTTKPICTCWNLR